MAIWADYKRPSVPGARFEIQFFCFWLQIWRCPKSSRATRPSEHADLALHKASVYTLRPRCHAIHYPRTNRNLPYDEALAGAAKPFH